MFSLSMRGRKGDFGLYLRGAFDDPESLPEAWKVEPAAERPPIVRQTHGGFWVTENPLIGLRAS